MQNWVKISRILVAAMFILSAISKMLSLPFFDGLVAELIIGEDYYTKASALFYTQLLTRFLIAAELVLGIALLHEYKLKSFVVPAVFIMLLLFTIHLFYEGFRSEKGFIEGNCGCFGDILPMNNLESILKNVAAMLLGIFIWLKYEPKEETKFSGWVMPTTLGAVTLVTLLLTVKDYGTSNTDTDDVVITESDTLAQEDTSTQINIGGIDSNNQVSTTNTKTDKLVETPSTVDKTTKEPVSKTIQMLSKLPKFSDGKSLNLTNGKELVCMFSMTCGHCQEIIKEICKTKNGPWPTISLVNFGKDFEQKYFFSQAGGCNYRHILTEDYMQFNKWLEGEGFPRILAIENGKIVKSWNLDTYTQQGLFEFYGIKAEAPVDNSVIPLNKPKEDSGPKKNPWD